MPAPRTMVTELGTGLGMLGYDTLDEALAARPREMVSVSPEVWDRLDQARAGGVFDAELEAAFANGAAFASANEGLRGRRPVAIEWKGSQRAPGDEVVPVDLRVDHVYLVSCKYLSKILFNASPAHLFEQLLVGPHGRRSADWYAEVARAEYDSLYQIVRRELSKAGKLEHAGVLALEGAELPASVTQLRVEDRAMLRRTLSQGWPAGGAEAYAALTQRVAEESATRWTNVLEAGEQRGEAREAMLWRLIRLSAAPYFVLGAVVLGTAGTDLLQLRIATPWDWRQHFRLESFDVTPQPGGQPRVGWSAKVRDRSTGAVTSVEGHVEVRWSHGRFGGLPEAKCYLDTSHRDVPGYFALR